MTRLDPLRPLPMSASAVADLVARFKARPDYEPFRNWTGRRPAGDPTPCTSAIAATYAYEHGVTVAAAARLYGRNPATVADYFHRLYPGVSAWAHRRRLS